MTKENITISKQALLKAYREAEPSQKEFMKQLFGADAFASNIMERVKTFQDAVNELGNEHPLVIEYNTWCKQIGGAYSADVMAYLKLRIITAALNEGWEPKFTIDEWRYYPYFYLLNKEDYEQLSDEDKKRCVGRSASLRMRSAVSFLRTRSAVLRTRTRTTGCALPSEQAS
jgi:hypothetical protein|nr:MAG TPA: hypothetical protein [Caudoviricetes sp.]